MWLIHGCSRGSQCNLSHTMNNLHIVQSNYAMGQRHIPSILGQTQPCYIQYWLVQIGAAEPNCYFTYFTSAPVETIANNWKALMFFISHKFHKACDGCSKYFSCIHESSQTGTLVSKYILSEFWSKISASEWSSEKGDSFSFLLQGHQGPPW